MKVFSNYLLLTNIPIFCTVGGTAGGHMSLRMSDKKKLVEEWVRVGKERDLHVMVQVGGASLPDVLEMVRFLIPFLDL